MPFCFIFMWSSIRREKIAWTFNGFELSMLIG
jgi:hypothetical protein